MSEQYGEHNTQQQQEIVETKFDPRNNLKIISPENMRDQINPNRRNCIIAVPKYHDNLYQIIKDNKEWLEQQNSTLHTVKAGSHYRKKVKTPEDLRVLNNILSALRTEKSELFLDFEFHKKPRGLPTREYINEFLRIKGIFSYYTFISWYRITVYHESGDPDLQNKEVIDMDKDGNNKIIDYPRKEYLLIPLLIRLKKNKIYGQFKSICYTNASGTEYEIRDVNPQHFLRDDSPLSREQEEKLREKVDISMRSKLFEDIEENTIISSKEEEDTS